MYNVLSMGCVVVFVLDYTFKTLWSLGNMHVLDHPFALTTMMIVSFLGPHFALLFLGI